MRNRIYVVEALEKIFQLKYSSLAEMDNSASHTMTLKRLLELAVNIHYNTHSIHEYLESNGLPLPSFASDTPKELPVEISQAQDAVLDATLELYDMLMNPLSAFLATSVRPSSHSDVDNKG